MPALTKLLLEQSPRRPHGSHAAQPVLCRAGPGTGKTWMIKQSMFLLASALSEQTDGVRLVPIIVFVQRIVRLLRGHGDDPTTLLSDPDGLMRWYISNEFGDRKEERTLLLQTYELRALVILLWAPPPALGPSKTIAPEHCRDGGRMLTSPYCTINQHLTSSLAIDTS